MAQCAGGSTKQGSAPSYFQFDTTTVASFLPFGSAIAFLGLLGLPVGPVDTAQFCSVEPPATVLTAADIVALGIPAVAKITGAYDRLANYVEQQAFATYCACVAGGVNPYEARVATFSPEWYFKMGESTGATVMVDSSGHSRNGVYTGPPTFGQVALLTGSPATSIETTSGFPSRNVIVGTDVWHGNQDSSMELWFTVTANPSGLAQLYTTYTGTDPFVEITMDTGGHIRLHARDSAANLLTGTYTTASYADSAIHQLDLVLDHTAHTLTLYIDGVQRDQLTGLTTNSYTDSGTVHWWKFDPHENSIHVHGRLGQAWFINHKLSATEISDNRAAAGGVSRYGAPTYTPPSDGTPPAGTAPTCSTNQDVCNVLATTNLLLQGVGVQLAEFSKRAAPVYWRTGTSHAGLTGTGVLSVLDTVGLRVQLTTVPAGWGSTAETPRRLIPSAGSIQAGYSSEYSDNWQLHYEDELILMEASWATQIRYNLRPGITATIVELQPGS